MQYRVSAVISNSPYLLVLDCDMFCGEPASARQAMCFHLDPKKSPSLAFVQFPQKFHNISKNDIYDSQHRSTYTVNTSNFDIISCNLYLQNDDSVFLIVLYFFCDLRFYGKVWMELRDPYYLEQDSI